MAYNKTYQLKNITTIQVLTACHTAHNNYTGLASWEILMKETSCPEKLVYSAMLRDESKGFINYGVSLRTSWVTEKGYEYLKLKNIIL